MAKVMLQVIALIFQGVKTLILNFPAITFKMLDAYAEEVTDKEAGPEQLNSARDLLFKQRYERLKMMP